MTLNDVLRQCEHTASWFGIRIESLTDRNSLGDTPLHTVCTWGDIASVKVLLEAGSDVNATGDLGASPLFNAIISGNTDLVRLLIVSGADPGFVDELGRTPLSYAKSVRESAIARVLEQFVSRVGRA